MNKKWYQLIDRKTQLPIKGDTSRLFTIYEVTKANQTAAFPNVWVSIESFFRR
jgi:hypothetical protein